MTDARPFRFGLIGAGVAAEIHVAAMRSVGVEVRAIADAVPERAQALATRSGIPEVYKDGEALAARAPVDAVAVLTPHHLHLPYVHAAARFFQMDSGRRYARGRLATLTGMFSIESDRSIRRYYATRDGEVVRVPSSGPANEIVRTGSFWPFPREADTTR